MTKSTTTAQIYANQINKLNWQRQQGKISAEEYKASVERIVVAEQAATTATRTLTSAFKLVGNILFSLAIDWLITKIQEVSKAEEEARQNAESASKSFLNEAEALKSLRKEYDNIISSNDDESKKNEQLIEWKKKLVEQYGFEEDAINRVTKARETGFEAIDKEMYENAKKQISELGDEYDKAVKAMESAYTGYFQNGIFDPHENRYTQTEVETLKNFNISTKMQYGTSTGYTATLSYGEDLVTSIENISNAINYFRGLTRDLSDSEKRLLGDLQSDYNRLTGIQKDYESQYSAGMQAYAQKAFYEFTHDAKNLQNSIESVTAETYEVWKENLLALAGDSEPLKELLLSFANDYFPQFSVAGEESSKQIGGYIISTAQKLEGLNSNINSLKETIDSAFSNQSTLQSAFDKIQEGSSLSADEVRKLVEICPELATEFSKTADGYTISSNALIKANENIVKSTRDSVKEQIDGYQEIIDKYEEYQKQITASANISGMPSSAQEAQKKALDLGISEEEYDEAVKQVNNLKLVFDMLGISLNKAKDAVNAFDKAIEDSTKSISLIKTAMEEMSEDGHISASTYQALVEKGEDYVACLELVDGKLTLNITKLKELEEQELRNIISKNNLRISELEAQKAHGGTAEVIDKETQALARQNAVLEQQIKDVWSTTGDSGSGSSSDPTKDAYTEKQKELKHLLEMEKITQAQYYEMLFGSNEYKALLANRTKYLDELNSIDEEYYKYQQNLYKDDADKQFDDLEDQYKRGIITAEQYAQGLYDLGQELYGEGSIYGGTEFAIKALEELDKKVKETSEDIYDEFKEGLSADGDKTLFNVLSDAEELWNKTNELFDGDLTSIKSNAKDIFGTVSSALEDALKKGIITVDGYESLLRSWADTLQVTEADITDALVDTYEYRADALQKANDGSLASERKYIADMKSLNFSTYGDENSDFYDPTTYASNLRDITDHQLDVLEKALNNGKISVQEYANSVVEIFKDADVLGADYVSEKLDDIDKARAEREKTYWEQQKELMEDYYDKQIKEIEDTQKAKEKENKLEELHLKLIKARQTLEEAKNNRNQLVFHDGTFEYMADQDAIMSAEEEVANTLKEIEDEKLQAQIDLLEEQKDAALGFYDQILDEIDFYLNKTLPLSESDQEELAKIRNSDYAQYARDKRDGNLAANSDNEKIAEDALNQTDIAEETKQSVSDIAKNVLDIAKVVANGFNFENLVRALGGNPTAEAVKNFQDGYNATLVGKQIVPSTLPSSVTNNSSTTNNSAKTIINIEKIFENLYMPEGTTKEQVEAFFKHLNSAILQRIPQVIIDVRK